MRVVKVKEDHLKGLKKVTKYVGTQITEQNGKIENLITNFRNEFEISGIDELDANEDPLVMFNNMTIDNDF